MTRKRPHQKPTVKATRISPGASTLRIIGGQLRGRSFHYNGDPGLRPMKDRVREAVFNLVGPAVQGRDAIDLFGGTGAMAFEALSRGAHSALIIERRFPTARAIADNAATLGISDRVTVRPGDAFFHIRKLVAGPRPWVVFCCPPYDFYVEHTTEMLKLITHLRRHAPPGSVIVVEADARFDTSLLPEADAWDIRHYPPAVVAVCDTADCPDAEST